MIRTPSIRVSQYRIGPGAFTGDSYDLKLNRPLVPDFFVLINGAVQDLGGNVGPDLTAIRVSATPYAHPLRDGIQDSGAPDVIRLKRQGTGADWIGVVQVVECERDHDGSGFRLIRHFRVALDNSVAVGVVAQAFTLIPPFSDEARGVLFGGPRAGGMEARYASAGPLEQVSAQARVYHQAGIGYVERYEATGADVQIRDVYATIFQVQWGSEWSVQTRNVTGSASGSGASAFHWNPAAITTVTRANTWVVANGWTYNDGPGESAAGMLVALGRGNIEFPTESYVTINYAASPGGSSSQVVVLSHPSLAVDWLAANSPSPMAWTKTAVVVSPIMVEDHAGAPRPDGSNVEVTTGRRLVVATAQDYHTALADYPASSWHSFHVSDSLVQSVRPWGFTATWRQRLQSVDFGALGGLAEELDAGSLEPPGTDDPESTTALVYVPNHADKAEADLLLTLRRPRITSLTRALAAGAQAMEDELFALVVDRDLQTATGAQLDQWGRLVGEPRGGLVDNDYRRFIQARIAANRSGGSTDELIRIWGLVTAPYLAIFELPLYPAGLQLVTIRETPMAADVVRRVARIMLDTARPSGISIDLVEGVTGYLGFVGNPEAYPLDVGTLARSLAP